MTTELTKAAQQACHCQTCRPITMEDMRMVLCPTCGNKRCPHANDHRNACTGSNEPGQPGSAYPASALTQRPAAQEVDDGDVTGQPGPLPETGWDEVPEGAFRKPSPTAGMNLGERIKHVGGRENAAGYIEFGSVAAVRALVRQYLRDLPAPQQATPEPWRPDVCPFTGLAFFMWIEHHKTGQMVPTYGGPYDSCTIPVRDADGSYCRERYDHDRGGWLVDEVQDVGVQIVSDQAYVSDEPPATPEPLTLGPLAKRNIYDAIRGAYDLGYNDARNARTVPGDSAPGYDGRSVEEDHGGALFNTLSKRLTPATPEPVGEPVGEAGTMPGTSGFTMACFHADKVPVGTKLYTRPAPGVPEGWALVPVEPTWEMCEAMPSLPAIGAPGDMELKAKGWSLKAIQNRHRWLAALAAAQAKGVE